MNTNVDVSLPADTLPALATTANTKLALSSISVDGGTQARAGLNDDVVEEYASSLEDGATFPPVVVYFDGSQHWLADGFHRYHATEKAGLTDIDVDVRQGTRRDAILHSVSANAEHGLRRSTDDKRQAVQTLLSDAEWSAWSDREIARRCRVSSPFVAKQRGITVNVYSETERKYPTRHGTVATMQTGNIGQTTRERSHSVTREIEPEFRADPEFQAEAEAAARDIEIERDERIALSGGGELAAENERLNKQIALLDRRIASLMSDNESLKFREKMWRERAIAAGWKEHANG